MKEKQFKFAGYSIQANSTGIQVQRETVDLSRSGDYGADPLPDGMFKMVPSGDIVSWEERCKRLGKKP